MADRWPPITEPELLRRLALDDGAFVELMGSLLASVGPRDFTDREYDLALGYPWARPPSSFLLDGEAVTPLDALPALDSTPRFELLAFGSNGAPEALTRKFAHLPRDERRLLVLAGELRDFDVSAAAHPTAYGSFPATIFPSPGTALVASVLWVTAAQLTALTWTEISYFLGRLDGVRFTPTLPGAPPISSVMAFVSRWGSHHVDGRPAALAALPADGRLAPAYTQEQLLDRMAGDVLGAGAGARDLVAWIFADFSAASASMAPLAQSSASTFASDRWTRYPAR